MKTREGAVRVPIEDKVHTYPRAIGVPEDALTQSEINYGPFRLIG